MAQKNKATLKNFFQTGDKPNQTQYHSLIDSSVNLEDIEQVVNNEFSLINSNDNILIGLSDTGARANIDLPLFVDSTLTASSDIQSKGDILLDEGKAIFFDGSDSTPNTRIKKDGTSMDFRTNGAQKLTLGISETTFNNNLVRIGNTSVPQKLHITDTISGSKNLFVATHVTASGNISSSSGTGSFGSLVVDGSSVDFTNLPTSDPGVAGRLWQSGSTAGPDSAKFVVISQG